MARITPAPQLEPEQGDALDHAAIAQLRETLTADMRRDLGETFRDQVNGCLDELRAAVQRGDASERRRVAHLLKGSCATMGASRLRALCERLEGSGEAESATLGEGELERLRQVAEADVRAVAEALA